MRPKDDYGLSVSDGLLPVWWTPRYAEAGYGNFSTIKAQAAIETTMVEGELGTEVGEQAIRKGDKVVLWYIAANRDESVFPDPHRFDIKRGNIQHLGFGTGQHVCVGSRLAEMQLRVAFGILSERVSRFKVMAPPRRLRSNFINGLKNLDVQMAPA